ncbi:MAG: SDR family oxidoreductase [Anaerolineae bacterium]|nr:SDR family oxidoreductase [Anaerolineae bacterium]
MKELNGKLALITGGSSGIGLALAKELAARGMRIAILSRRLDALQSAGDDILAAGAKELHVLPVDVSVWEDVERNVGDFIHTIGIPDLLVNCAGVVRPGLFEELTPDLFQWMIQINLLGPIYMCKAVIPGMLERGSGHVVNVSSVAGFLGTYGYSAYGASKFGLRGFSDVLRSEYRHRGIQVSVVFPPDTDTPQLAGEKPYKPEITRILSESASVKSAEDVALAIRKGIEKGKYRIVPGFESKAIYLLNNLPFDLGYRVMDWMVANARKKANRNVTA